MKITSREKQIAKQLGVTPVGLNVLCRAVATGGKSGSWAGGNPGSAKAKLEADGLIRPNAHGGLYEAEITEAGREIVRRARAMGW